MSFRDKILTASTLPAWRREWRASGKTLVVTNGCFDVLHLGHVTYLEAARGLGQGLLVGVTSNTGVRGLKGPGRPVNPQEVRAAILAALQSVDAVYVFPDQTALRFLGEVQPDIYVKGGDYTLETINQEERNLLESIGAKIVILPNVPGQSTTGLLKKLAEAEG